MLCVAGVASAKKVLVEATTVNVTDGCLVINNPQSTTQYFVQLLIATGINYVEGNNYEIDMTYNWTADAGDPTEGDVEMEVFAGWGGRQAKHGTISAGGDKTLSLTWNSISPGNGNGDVMLQCGNIKGVLKVKKVEVYQVDGEQKTLVKSHDYSVAGTNHGWMGGLPQAQIEYEWYDRINVGESFAKVYPASNPSEITDEEIVIVSPAKVSQDWDTQFWVRSKQALPAGASVKLTFDCKASSNQTLGNGSIQYHEEPANYLGGVNATIDFTTEWKPYELTINVPSEYNGSEKQGSSYKNEFKSIAFNLTKGSEVTYYFKNVKLVVDKDDFDYSLDPDYRPETAVGTGDIEINDTDPAIVAAKVALLSAITRAKSDEVRANKTKASLAALDEVINAGLAQLTAKPITVTEKVKKEVETKKELTFSTAEYCAAKWNATDKTLQWGQGGWNPAFTFMTADDIKGDVTEWQKLHLKATNFVNSKENKLLVKFKEDDGKWPPSGPETDFIVETDAEGNIDIDLTAADIDWKTDRTKLADLTIYGQERESTETYGQVTVSEAWLSKTEEKEVEETTTKMPDVTVASLKAAATEIRMAVNELVDRAPVAELEVPAGWRSVIKNGTLEGDDLSCFFSKDNSSDPYKSVTVDYEGIDEHKAIVLQTGGSKAATDWEDQFFIRATEILPAGKKFRVEFDYRSDINASGESQCHEQPGNYIHYACIGSPSFKSDWQHYTFEGTVPNECDGKMNNENTYLKNFQTIAFNLSKTRKDVKFVFDNIQFLVEDPVTVIKGVETVAGKDEYYDLQGRRVAQPGKGLYIKNGKKVAIK